MKTKFGNKEIVIPGSYARTESGIKKLREETRGILIIDSGLGENYIGGSGFVGENKSGLNSLMTFFNINEMREKVRGGYWWKLAEPLFFPNGNAGNTPDKGVGFVMMVKASTTTAASLTLTWVGGTGAYGNNGGSITIKTVDEGKSANGALDETSDLLYVGYGVDMIASDKTDGYYKLKFLRGNYKGSDDQGQLNSLHSSLTEPELLCVSDEFQTVPELIAWMQRSQAFGTWFILDDYTLTLNGLVDDADLTNTMVDGTVLFAGATEVYSTDSVFIQSLLDDITELPYDFILSDNFGENGKSELNDMLLTHIKETARYDKVLIVGGGNDSTEFEGLDSSTDIAQHFDSDRVIVVHGGIKIKNSKLSTGFNEHNVLYKSAAVAGRLCGLEPQVPITFKAIGIDGELDILNNKRVEKAISNGVLVTRYDMEVNKFCVVQGVNSLQAPRNEEIINEDGTTPYIQLRYLAAAINKKLMIDARRELFDNPVGTNRNTLSERILVDWVSGKLENMIAKPEKDNYILKYEKVSVVTNGDTYEVTYGFYPNLEITKLFFTGFVL